MSTEPLRCAGVLVVGDDGATAHLRRPQHRRLVPVGDGPFRWRVTTATAAGCAIGR
ncbi:hypothetical protein [Micromonospora sp. SH-82]|uniref:hypothetical protein n=1 Tax=Micromonospora sp. SH-82 TaxID=3132938 RepID=UPI003EC04951